MILFSYFILFFFGTAIGSFLGVVVDRMSSRESIWKGRSHCDHCRHNLHAFDLIPVFSFFLLGRNCRYCKAQLSWFYPLVELLTGASFVLAFYNALHISLYFFSGFQSPLLIEFIGTIISDWALISSLIVIAFTDIRYGIIPFKIVIFALSIIIVHILFSFFVLGIATPLLSLLLSAFGTATFFFFLFSVTKGRGMGFGDVVYAFLMGFALGFPNILLGLYIAFISGAVVSLALVLLKKKHLRGGTIPFGPFLVLGTIVCLLWGDYLIKIIFRYLMGNS
jgi:prepilin signal peptidase PulO-like enzyme (type II secretory pathway)